MKNSFSMHILNSSENLEHIIFNFLIGKQIFFTFQTFIQIHIHKLKDKC